MPKKVKIVKAKKADKAKQSNIPVDITVGILHTVAEAIYSTETGKVREAVANATDNGATWIVIVPDQTKKSLTIVDNGGGIADDMFHTIFKSIGYGLLQDDEEPRLSYFCL